MRRMIAPLFAVALLLGVAAAAHADDPKFVIDPIAFPDGSRGVAVVRVLPLAGSLLVVADYYTEDSVRYLGSYQDYSGGEVPAAQDEAREFAFNHFFDKH